MGEFVKSYGTVTISFIVFIYTVMLNKRTSKIQKKIKEVQLDVLQASSLYENVKNMNREYKAALSELTILTSISKEDMTSEKRTEIYRSFLNLYQKYTDFFNEIEDYCLKVNVGAISAEDYIRNTVSKNLSTFANYQVETFEMLNDIANRFGFKKVDPPDYNAFKEYDKFLIKYNGENSSFWTTLKTNRRNKGFES